MPCCTYLTEQQYTAPLADKEMQELLTELRETTKEDWRIGEHRVQFPRLFRKPIVKVYYELYVDVCKGIEFQVINPCREVGQDAFALPSRSQIMNYILGYLAGISYTKRKNTPITGDKESMK